MNRELRTRTEAGFKIWTYGWQVPQPHPPKRKDLICLKQMLHSWCPIVRFLEQLNQIRFRHKAQFSKIVCHECGSFRLQVICLGIWERASKSLQLKNHSAEKLGLISFASAFARICPTYLNPPAHPARACPTRLGLFCTSPLPALACPRLHPSAAVRSQAPAVPPTQKVWSIFNFVIQIGKYVWNVSMCPEMG